MDVKLIYTGVFTPSSTNYAQAIGFERNGCDLTRFHIRDIQTKYSKEKANEILIAEVAKTKYNYLVIAKGTGITGDIIKECKKYCPVVLWFMDAPCFHWDAELEGRVLNSDYVFCDKLEAVDKSLLLNKNSYWVCEGYDSDIDKPYDLEKDINASFIGGAYGIRGNVLRACNVQCFSAYAEEHAKIVSRSKININICTGKTASDRVYKIMAAGGFLLTDDWYGRDKIFEDRIHLVIWNDIKDLQDKIEYYIENKMERIGIAKTGYLEVQKYSRINWAKNIIETITK